VLNVPIPRVPALPTDPAGVSQLFEAEVHRTVVSLHQSVDRRARWLRTLLDQDITSTPNRRRHNVLARKGGSHAGQGWPWRFNVTADGNGWWPSFSRVVAAEARGGEPRGRLGAIYQAYVGGQSFDSLGPEAPAPLSPGARTFWLRFTLSPAEAAEYHADDTFRPGIPAAAIEVQSLALAAVPPENTYSIWVPWVDVPPAAPPAARNPTYHFSLWFRFSHYWHRNVAPEESSSSSSLASSSSSGQSSSGQSSSDSATSKPVVL